MSYVLRFGKHSYFRAGESKPVVGLKRATIFDTEGQARKAVEGLRVSVKSLASVDLLYLDKTGKVVGIVLDV